MTLERETADQAAELAELLDFLKGSRGFDFTGYKKTTLRRRIEKRTHAVKVGSYGEYQDYLEANPREFTELFNTILINVTSFFRDAPAWAFLAEEVVPELLAGIPDSQPIRVWSAGCASGEEPYTAAMVLAEALGVEAFRARVKIYATDLDDDALTEARQAVYPEDALKPIPDALVDKYFEQNHRGLVFRTDMRRSVIFGRNDLVSDAPISRIDLLICRNVLMYFIPEAQHQILERFNFALNPSGKLFLGKSEMLITHSDLFAADDLRWRVFKKVERAFPRDRVMTEFGQSVPQEPDGQGVRNLAASMSPVAQVVIDRGGFLQDANVRARELFSLGAADRGRPFQDLALSYRPADLRSAIEQAYERKAVVQVGRIEYSRPGADDMVLDVEVAPVVGRAGEELGATVLFSDVTALVRLAADYDNSRRELGAAYEELQSTVEELETTNEELQSTNEELETTNEELQSTNEELETMNEELQSTNDELENVNTEVGTRAVELDRVNLFLEGILGSLGLGMSIVDSTRSVQVWNPMSEEMWGVRRDEAEGKDILALDIGFPLADLTDELAKVLEGREDAVEKRVQARDRRGRDFECTIRIMQLRTGAGEIYGAMILTAPEDSELGKHQG